MKVIKTLLIAMVVLLAPLQVASAQEITPDPESYEYGSTSEYSPYETIDVQDTPSEDTEEDGPSESTDGSSEAESAGLADTGMPTNYLLLMSIIALIVGSSIVAKKQKSTLS